MKKKIDERQEQELFKCEHAAFRIMFGVSAIVIIIQLFMQATWQQTFGETIILICGGVSAIWGYLKNGLWSYNNIEPSVKSNLMYSIICSLVATLLFGIVIYIKAGSAVIKAIAIGMFFGVIFILVFVVLTLLGGLINNKKRKMENEYKDI